LPCSEMSWREWQQGTPLNEIRMRDDLTPIEGGDGAYVPVNMVPYKLAGKQQQSQKLVQRDLDNLRAIFRNAADREIKKQISGKGSDFNEWMTNLRVKIFGIIERDISLTIECTHATLLAGDVLAEIRQEFEQRFVKLAELPGCNYANYEKVIQ